jgi:cytochrome P450
MNLNIKNILQWAGYLMSILPLHFAKAAGAFLLLKFVDKFSTWLFSPLNRIPGPNSKSFLFGVFPSIRRDPYMTPHKKWWKEAGVDAKLLHYTTMFGRQSIVVLDKEIVKDILTAPAGKKNTRFNKNHDFLKYILGDGLVTLEGPDWDRHRRIIQPSFSSSFLKDTLNKSVPDKAKQLVAYWKAAQGREIDAASHMSAITLDIIGDVAFGHQFHGMAEIERWVKNEGSEKVPELQDLFISSILNALKPNMLTFFFSTFGMARFDNKLNPKSVKCSKLVNKAVHDVVLNAKKSPEKNKSLLQLLLSAKDTNPNNKSARTLTDKELQDETKTFLVAGHETTSTWCYWALYALAKHPDVQEKVCADIKKHSKGADTITWEMVDDMEYLHAFLQEVLRLFPPVGLIVRTNNRNEDLGGYHIPFGTRIILPIHLLHRHPLYWDDPEKFSPERWMDGKMDEDRIRFAFLPFSAGGRNCIGQRFATIETKLILAPLIQSFIFQVAPSQRDTEFTFTSFVTMKSRPGLKIVAQSR